jgi:hypothetical protein
MEELSRIKESGSHLVLWMAEVRSILIKGSMVNAIISDIVNSLNIDVVVKYN